MLKNYEDCDRINIEIYGFNESPKGDLTRNKGIYIAEWNRQTIWVHFNHKRRTIGGSA